MALLFEWDVSKAVANRSFHGVSFEEAATVFGDPLSLTTFDSLHSDAEDRFITVGLSIHGRLIVVVHTERRDRIRIIVHENQLPMRGGRMKRDHESDPDMLDEYDFRHGTRGKYAERYAAGSNVIVLAPDVAEFFPDSESVNQTLRALIELARRHQAKRPA